LPWPPAAPAPAPKNDADADRKALLKKVIKEGGKRGVEIEGAADMGGLQFFCTAVDLPNGDVELLLKSMEAMNEKSDPTEEERKGGSGHVGKMIFSAGEQQLAVVAYVPEAKQGELNCEEWLKTVLASQGGELKSSSKDLCSGTVAQNKDKGVFPLKIREPMLLEANNFLRKKGLFPDNDSDDDDEETPAGAHASPAANQETPSRESSEVEVNQRTLNIVLRMRNPRRELNDIRFEYKPTSDTAEGIAQELLGTGLITDEDVQPMASNLQMIVTKPPPNKVITFRVTTGFAETDVLDEQNLNGFAQLSLTD